MRVDHKGQSSVRHVELIALASRGSAWGSSITLVSVQGGQATKHKTNVAFHVKGHPWK